MGSESLPRTVRAIKGLSRKIHSVPTCPLSQYYGTVWSLHEEWVAFSTKLYPVGLEKSLRLELNRGLIFASKLLFEALELPMLLNAYLDVQTEVKAHPDQEGIEFFPCDGTLESSRFDKLSEPSLKLRYFVRVVPSSSLKNFLGPSNKDSANRLSRVLRLLLCDGFWLGLFLGKEYLATQLQCSLLSQQV
jgi:hypothetical protein